MNIGNVFWTCSKSALEDGRKMESEYAHLATPPLAAPTRLVRPSLSVCLLRLSCEHGSTSLSLGALNSDLKWKVNNPFLKEKPVIAKVNIGVSLWIAREYMGFWYSLRLPRLSLKVREFSFHFFSLLSSLVWDVEYSGRFLRVQHPGACASNR